MSPPSLRSFETKLHSDLTPRSAKRLLTDQFRQAGLAFAEEEALELVMAVCGKTRTEIILDDRSLLTAKELKTVADYAKRRLSGEPIDAILGWREFYGRRFQVTKEVLSPRQDTETLIRLALKALEGKTYPTCLDLGTGSGAIILTLLAERQDLKGVAVDISEQALSIAKSNAVHLGVSDRVDFFKSAWFENVTGTHDLIVSNPPYISDEDMKELEAEVLGYDPDISLRGGADGLDSYRRIVMEAKKFLAPEGFLWFEIGYNQAKAVQSLLLKSDFSDIEVHKDLSGQDRCVGGKRPS